MEFSKNKDGNELSCNSGPFHFLIFLYDDCANIVWHYDHRHGDVVLVDEQTAIGSKFFNGHVHPSPG